MEKPIASLVEYQFMRPQAMAERRDAMPVAYMGLGVFEWHGLHNPLGLDAVKANGIACHIARRLGGIVMPPQYYGDNRAEYAELEFTESFALDFAEPENKFDHTAPISDLYGIAKEAFEKDAARSLEYGGWELWEKLMVRTMFQIETMGFKAIVLIPGHFPLIAPTHRAIRRYADEGGNCRVLALAEFGPSFAEDNLTGDHAASYETSLMLALCPELVDIGALDPDLSKPNIGVIGKDPRVHASREFGERILEKFVSVAERFVLGD